MLRKTVFLILFGVVGFLLTGCNKGLKSDVSTANNPPTAQIYYTQFSLFQEKNTFRTTNYRKGLLIPINTAVTLQAINDKEAELRLMDSGQKLTLENVSKHTGDTMQMAFAKIAGLSKVDLTPFSAAEREAIMLGKVIKGMNRQAVLAAIGYPPITETPSLTGNAWTYWSNRFNRFVVHFKNDKVENIVD